MDFGRNLGGFVVVGAIERLNGWFAFEGDLISRAIEWK